MFAGKVKKSGHGIKSSDISTKSIAVERSEYEETKKLLNEIEKTVEKESKDKRVRVFDTLNETWYNKDDLLKESFDIFVRNHPKERAIFLASQYVKENAISPEKYPEWRFKNRY